MNIFHKCGSNEDLQLVYSTIQSIITDEDMLSKLNTMYNLRYNEISLMNLEKNSKLDTALQTITNIETFVELTKLIINKLK